MEDLITAAQKGDDLVVQHIFEDTKLRPDLMVKSEGFTRSILSVAASYGHTSVVEDILKCGANPAVKDATGRIPLHEACIGGHVEVVCLLLSHMPDIDINDRCQKTPAHYAAYNGEVLCLEVLANSGANLDAKDRDGRRPAHYAAMRNHVNVLHLLLDLEVDLDNPCLSGKTPLHYASQHGALESVKMLLKRGCKVDSVDSNHYSPLHLAARYNRMDCMRVLLNHGGSACDVVLPDGRAPVHLVSGAGNTPAHYSCKGRKPECLNCCVRHVASLDITNILNDTPFDTAKKAGCLSVMIKASKCFVISCTVESDGCSECLAKQQRQLKLLNEEDRLSNMDKILSAAMSTAYATPF